MEETKPNPFEIWDGDEPEDFLGMLAPSQDIAKPKEEEETSRYEEDATSAKRKASDDPAKSNKKTKQSQLLDAYHSLEFEPEPNTPKYVPEVLIVPKAETAMVKISMKKVSFCPEGNRRL